MNAKAIVLLILGVLVVSIVVVGCGPKSQTGYATYNQQQGQQQPYVGGGCGVAPSGAYEDTPIESLDSANSAV
jgi:hypothetical protein